MTEQTYPQDGSIVDTRADTVLARPHAHDKRRYLGRSGRDYGVLTNRDTVRISTADFDPTAWAIVEDPSATVLEDNEIPHVPFGLDWGTAEAAVTDNIEPPTVDGPFSVTSEDADDAATSSGRRAGRNRS